MAHTSNIFDSQPIRVQNVNGFDLSHLNCGTALCGTLTPVLCRLLMQDTKFDLGVSLQVELPPLATNFFGRIDANIEVFFVPCSILYGGWKQFISNQANNMFPVYRPSQSSGNSNLYPVTSFDLPRFNLADSTLSSYVQNLDSNQYCLLDYLGMMDIGNYASSAAGTQDLNLMSLLAYHRIWDVYYRNPQVTKTIFAVNPNSASSTVNQKNVSLIWHSFYSDNVASSIANSSVFATISSTVFPDSTSVFSLRQRNYPRDYFTAASLMPQQVPSGGTVATLGFTVAGIDPNSPDSSGNLSGSGAFTIASLRAVNALAKFMEASNYDPTYEGIMRAHFGRTPSDADHDKPIYIGRCVVPIYQKSIYNTNQYAQQQGDNVNPFASSGTLGSKGAHGSFIGEGQICKNFRAGCFGYLMGLFSLVPHAMYSSGIDKHFTLLNIGDFPFPELQSVGMDAIRQSEVYYSGNSNEFSTTFGYIPRFSYWKYIDDQVHGLLRPGQSLDAFVLQRRFSVIPQQISTDFCEIPINALDSVFATTTDVSHFSCWYEVFWVFKAVMPLAAFCVPTLGDLQDTHTIKVSQGGSKL